MWLCALTEGSSCGFSGRCGLFRGSLLLLSCTHAPFNAVVKIVEVNMKIGFYCQIMSNFSYFRPARHKRYHIWYVDVSHLADSGLGELFAWLSTNCLIVMFKTETRLFNLYNWSGLKLNCWPIRL